MLYFNYFLHFLQLLSCCYYNNDSVPLRLLYFFCFHSSIHLLVTCKISIVTCKKRRVTRTLLSFLIHFITQLFNKLLHFFLVFYFFTMGNQLFFFILGKFSIIIKRLIIHRHSKSKSQRKTIRNRNAIIITANILAQNTTKFLTHIALTGLLW